MARSHGIIKCAVWNVGSEFRQLGRDPQWTFAMLISQPQINNCGVLPYTPEKWARYANDLTPAMLADSLETLEREHFIVIDENTGELLVRTFIKHDRVWKQPNLVKSARKQVDEIESSTIRTTLRQHYAWLFNDTLEPSENNTQQTPSETPSIETPSQTPSQKPLPEPLAYAHDAGARARPQPLPQPPPLPQKGSEVYLEAEVSRETKIAAMDTHDEQPDTSDPIIRLLLAIPDRDPKTETILRRYTNLPEAAFDYTRDELRRTGKGAGYAITILKRIQAEGLIANPPSDYT